MRMTLLTGTDVIPVPELLVGAVSPHEKYGAADQGARTKATAAEASY